MTVDGCEYEREAMDADFVLVPVLRSGLGLVDAVSELLPSETPIYHLGIFRDPVQLSLYYCVFI